MKRRGMMNGKNILWQRHDFCAEEYMLIEAL